MDVVQHFGALREKCARHALDRLKERTNLDPAIIAELDAEADKLTRNGIAPGHYYSHLPDNQGYAAFKTVGPDNDKLVLATILAKYMRPKGTQLELPLGEKRAYSQDQAEVPDDLHQRFDHLKKILGRRGVYVGTGHKRITIPKTTLSEGDVKNLGFQKVLIAIPEAGQDRFTSYRHPAHTYHLHSHGDRWTMHKDRHAAATMLAKTQGPVASMVKGVPHVVTEGVPGLYYYLKGQVTGRGSTADLVENALRPETKQMIASLAGRADGEAKAAMEKAAYSNGSWGAQQMYGNPYAQAFAPPPPNPEKKDEPGLLRRALPMLALGGAGLGAYKYMRSPSFSSNPALAKLQQRGATEGVNRLVNISEKKPFVPDPKQEWHHNLYDRFTHWLQPGYDAATGRMSAWDRFKLKMVEGPGAVPYTYREHPVKGDQMHFFNPDGTITSARQHINLKGVVSDRAHLAREDVRRIHGGVDFEGNNRTQSALTKLDKGGKAFESSMLLKHVDPEYYPETVVGTHKFLRGTKGSDAARIRALQKQLEQRFPEGYLMKPSQGVSSHGQFPMAGEDWVAHHKKYRAALAGKDGAKIQELLQNPASNDFADYMVGKGLLPGYILDHALKNPKDGVIVQKMLADTLGEARVHTYAGSAEPSMMMPRWGETVPEVVKNTWNLRRPELKNFVEGLLKQLPPEYRKGAYGMDVMLHRKPDGSIGYKLIEMNPTMKGTLREPGGGSGLRDAANTPWAGNAEHRILSGQHTPLVAGAAAVPAAAGAYGLAKYLTNPGDDQDRRQAA